MPPRSRPRPLGRADHLKCVAAVESELDRLLKGIATDPAAGPWGPWAAKLLDAPPPQPEHKSTEA